MDTKQKNISFGYGIRRTPSIGEAGELSDCVNIIPKNGEMVNIIPPKDLGISLLDNEVLKAVHRSSVFDEEHYIVYVDEDGIRAAEEKKKVPSLTPKAYLFYRVTNKSNGATLAMSLQRISGEGTLSITGTFPTIVMTMANGTTYNFDLDEFVDSYDFSADELAEMGWSLNNQVASIKTIGADLVVSSEESGVFTTYTFDDVVKYTGEAEVLVGGVLYWFTKDDTERKVVFTVPTGVTLTKVDTIGNTLVLLLSSGMEYVLFRDGGYVSLGNTVPEISVKLALSGEMEMKASDYKVALNYSEDEVYSFENAAFADHEVFTGELSPGRDTWWKSFDFSGYTEAKLERGKTYRLFNYTNYKIKVQIGSSFKDESQSSLNNSTTIYIKGNKYSDYTPSQDKAAMILSFDKNKPATISLGIYKNDSKKGTFHPSNETSNVDMVLGVAAEFISDATQEDHKFVSPFFARTGIKLYDGSIIHQSVPCLLIPTSKMEPIVLYTKPDSTERKDTTATMFTAGMRCDLQYYISQEDLDKLEIWKDIITGITFGSTKPIYLYDQDPKKGEGYYPLGKPGRQAGSSGRGGTLKEYYYGYTISDVGDGYKMTGLDELVDNITDYGLITLPEVQATSVNAKPAEFDNFYQLKDVKISDLVADEYTTLDLTDKNLMAIETLQVMSDDNGSHNRLIPSLSYVFNSRLNIGNIKEQVWSGAAMDEYGGHEVSGSTDVISARIILNMIIDNQSVTTGNSTFTTIGTSACNFRWFYYPRTKVSAATIFVRLADGTYEKAELELQDHPFMKGSYWFNDYNVMDFETCTEEEAHQETDLVYDTTKNRICTSNVNNPFTFPELLQNDIADGELLGLSASTKPLSTGQFGEQPMYAFMSTGIWALQPGTNGEWSSIQPVSRDVINSDVPVTQLDNALVFVTEKGLKMLFGSQIVSLSDRIEGFNAFEDFYTSTLPTDLVMSDNVQFRELIQSCIPVYDSINQHLHLFVNNNKGHYVCDLESTEFAKQVLESDFSDVNAIVPGYPYSTMQFGNKLYQYKPYSVDERSDVQSGYLLTRIYAFDDPFARKALMDLRCFGQDVTNNSKVSVQVYISNDKMNWVKLTSLKMKSAKFFRFLIKTSLTDVDTLSGMTLTYQERFTHKIR